MRALYVALLLAVAVPLPAQRPIPDGTLREGTLSFDGRATVGDFIGTTSEITGEMRGGAELAAVRGWVEAPVKSLKTGNGRRDRDLNKSMETDKYPTMRFDLAGVTATGQRGDATLATLHGTLLIHGVSRKVALPAAVTLGTDAIRLRSDFPMNLKDYKIGGLSKALGMLKMDENIVVHVDLLFAPR